MRLRYSWKLGKEIKKREEKGNVGGEDLENKVVKCGELLFSLLFLLRWAEQTAATASGGHLKVRGHVRYEKSAGIALVSGGFWHPLPVVVGCCWEKSSLTTPRGRIFECCPVIIFFAGQGKGKLRKILCISESNL